MYKLICMSFDGEYQTERPVFETIDAAWEYLNDIGSKWFFYPFHFVTTESGKTIADAPGSLAWSVGHRVKSIAHVFEAASKRADTLGLNAEQYCFAL